MSEYALKYVKILSEGFAQNEVQIRGLLSEQTERDRDIFVDLD